MMAQLITVRLNKSDSQPLGFRLQGGKDFGTPLVVQKVNGGSAAERAGLQAGDALIRVNNTDVYLLRHQEAQDTIRAAGGNLELTVQRGGGTWRPTVTPTGSLPRPGSRSIGGTPTLVTNTSLKATPQPSRAFGSGHNNVAKPFGYMNGNDSVKSIVNKQYNTPVNMYSDKTIAETLSAQTEVLAGGVLGVNFKKNEKTYDAEKSAVFKVLQEEQNDPEPAEPVGPTAAQAAPVTGLRHVQAPVTRPDAPINNTGGLPPGQNICEECERLITLHRTHRSRSRTPRVVSTPQPTQPTPPVARACAGTQTPQEKLAPEPPHRPSIPMGCHEVLPDGRIALGAPALPQPRDALPVVNDTPYCSDCNRYIIGVFVRIKDKNLHVECFKCSTCGTSLKNQGYYNLNGKLYCDIHAKLVARNNPPAPNLEPVTVPPGSRIPSNTYSTPLPPLATSNYTNGSSSLFSPSSNLSGPKPFGSSIGSAYSPSLSPRSAPMSPARPVTAPALAPAPLAAPISAPQPAAPFAPTQNVKSIVWPPPANPSDDEPPKYEPSIKPGAPACAKEQGTRVLNKINPNSDSTIADVQQQSMEKFIASSKQREEFTSSSVSYASAAMSSMTATSKSESVVQSKQSQVVQESTSRTIQSFSQESSECQSTTVYQTQTCPPKSFENSSDAIENIKTQMIQSKENIQSRTAKEVESTNITEPPNDQVKAQQPQKTDTKIESDNGSAIQVSAQINTKENNQVCNEALMQKNNEEIVVNQQTATFDTQSKTSIEKTQTEPPIANAHMAATENIQKTMNPSGLDPNAKSSMVDALTTAPDRPYSPLPTAQQPINLTGQTMAEEKPTQYDSEEKSELKECAEIKDVQLPAQPSPMFSQEKRGITPIPPIKTYNPPEKVAPPVPMPEETKPYIPPDFKIVIEPKEPRETTSTPLIEALTIAPDRPFTPVATYDQNQAISRESYDQNQTMSNGPYDQTQSIGRGSLREALTIAPDRPYSPFGTPGVTQSNQYMTSTTHVTETNLSEIVKPIATQTLTQTSDQLHSEFSTMQNTCKLQSSSEMSAFRPVPKQVFPPPQPEEFCKLTNFPPISNELKTSFTQATKTKQETTFSESMVVQQSSLSTSMATQGYSTVKTAQNYFEQLDKKESLTSTAVRSKSGLHKPDSIPPYQKNFEQLLSQRGISPDIYNAPAVLQRPVTPSTGTPTRPKEKSVEPHPTYSTPQTSTPKFQQVRTPVQQPPVQFHKDTPITMTFQPVTDDNFMRVPSPSRSSRPVTPNSLINKPAPIIPHYQMNLVTVEHLAPESHLFEPSSREGSRSPTPKPRSRSPAQGPPPNPLKAHAPRIKESAPQNYSMDSFSSQDPSNWRKQHERDQKEFQTAAEIYNTGGGNKNWASQPPIVKEQRHSNVGYKSENYTKGDMKIKEDSLIQENYGQRQMQSQNVIAQGNTTVQTTRKTFEEYERTQSAKVVEIRKGGSSIAGAYEQNMDCNIRPSNLNPKQVFPPPMMSLPSTQQSSSLNLTNQNMTSASRTIDNYDPKPSISGANQGPVCDPTPSTGSSVGAAARGKTFGVSSAPKRGRGVLNKAALPGSRVPLCASCNGNIRGPFITALGRIWCPEHFICVNATCRRPLQDIGFVEENGQLYCEFCFEQYIAPACDKCHAKIKGDCLNAIGKHYHPECFNCVYCGKLFGNNPFFLEDGLPYCEADWNDLFTTKCFACGFPVEAGDRCAKRTSKDRVSSPREVDLSVRHTPARSPQQMMYNSDTVYTTTTFRPVSPSPITPPLNTPSPQRTRKLETPLHFDGGLFSDIRSTDGKLLSKVTVDRVQQSSRHDITDSPSVFTDGKNYVDDIVKTETITNENVITVKFTPVPPELDSPRLLTPSQMYKTRQKTPVEYIKDNFEDLQSYKIVSSVVKEKLLEKENLTPVLNEGGIFENHDTFANTTCKENVYEKDSFISDSNVKEKLSTSLDTFEPIKRAPSPLANLFISEQLTKIDSYLQESLEVCTGVKDRYTPIPIIIEGEKSGLVDDAEMASCVKETYDQKEVNFSTTEIKPSSNNKREDEPLHRREKTTPEPYSVEYSKTNVSKLNSAKQAVFDYFWLR
ncbi:unnamed protein product [Spodoptera exigua]|nr:unnamed protein product [Spodoptera exigua]